MQPNQPSTPRADLVFSGQQWIVDAIAQQEEHLRRSRPCAGDGPPNPTPGMDHSWDRFSSRPGVVIEQCWRCKVTKSDEDYRHKIGS